MLPRSLEDSRSKTDKHMINVIDIYYFQRHRLLCPILLTLQQNFAITTITISCNTKRGSYLKNKEKLVM